MVPSLVPCLQPLGLAVNRCAALQLLWRICDQIHPRSIPDPSQTHQPELPPSTCAPTAGKGQTGCTEPAEPCHWHTPWKAFPAPGSHQQLGSAVGPEPQHSGCAQKKSDKDKFTCSASLQTWRYLQALTSRKSLNQCRGVWSSHLYSMVSLPDML